MNAEVFGSLPTPLPIEQLRVGVDIASASTENSDLPVPSLAEALGVSASNEIGLPVPQPFEQLEADKVAGNAPVPLSLAELQATGSAVTGTDLPVPQPLEEIAKIGAGESAAPEPISLEQLQALGSNASC